MANGYHLSTDLAENADREGPGLQLISSLCSKTSLALTFKRNLISTPIVYTAVLVK